MGRSFQIMSISGIPLKIHWTFPLLFLWILYEFQGYSISAKLIYSGFVLSLFVCVILHELGHAFAARRYNVRTVDIIISPIGGVARLTKLPTKPIQEFIVAVAGPMVNVVIALIIGIFLFISQGSLGLSNFDFNDMIYNLNLISFLTALMLLNITLVIFNLIPAFPMDGGRIFRSLLSMRFSRLTATRVASILGQISAVAFVAYAIWDGQSLVLGFIGVFIFFSANSEYQMVKISEALNKYTVADIMRVQYSSLLTSDTIQDAKDLLIKDSSGDYIIQTETGDFVGVLTRGSLIKAVKKEDFTAHILKYASDRIAHTHPTTNLKEIFSRMQEEEISDFIVRNDEGELVGIIDIQGMNTFLKTQNQLQSKRSFSFNRG